MVSVRTLKVIKALAELHGFAGIALCVFSVMIDIGQPPRVDMLYRYLAAGLLSGGSAVVLDVVNSKLEMIRRCPACGVHL